MCCNAHILLSSMNLSIYKVLSPGQSEDFPVVGDDSNTAGALKADIFEDFDHV